MTVARRVLITCLLLYAGSQVLFLAGIESVGQYVFDEVHYVPAAKRWLALEDPANLEHPPLGKQLIALGIAVWGDRPLGWRFMSAVFGGLTLVGVYLWGRELFRSESAALLTAFVTLGNQVLYVQSRVGMLDGFMFAFEVFGLAAVCRAWDPSVSKERARHLLFFAGSMFGLATACKWTGALGWLLCAAAVVGGRLMAHAGVQRRAATGDPWYDPRLFASLTIDDLVTAFVVVPLGAYFATFLPYLFVARVPRYGLADLLVMQKGIWQLQQLVVNPRSYSSAWTSWPLMLRPVWYFFGWEPDRSAVRCVAFLGNPLVMWGGLVALGICAWSWLKRASRPAFWIVLVWATFYLSFAVIPRKVTYYFYYYPAAMTLGPALTCALQGWAGGDARRLRWGSALLAAGTFALFVYFFEILCGTKLGSEVFRPRMWFRSWY